MSTIRIDIWSDIACPWCYVGKRRLETALARFEHAAAVQIHWRAFELDPHAPRVRDASQTYAERLAAKYRVGVEEADAMIRRMTQTAALEGLDVRFDIVRGGNTFDAHRVLHLAAVRDRQDAVKERLLRAYFTEGQPLGEPDVLRTLAVEAGLDGDEVTDVLEGDRYSDDVRADEALARELGISGVPFFVLAGRLGVSGAQPADVLLGALDRAWRERADGDPAMLDDAACGPDGCT